MHCSPPGSSVHGILQARTLEWVSFPALGDPLYPGIGCLSPTSIFIGRHVLEHQHYHISIVPWNLESSRPDCIGKPQFHVFHPSPMRLMIESLSKHFCLLTLIPWNSKFPVDKSSEKHLAHTSVCVCACVHAFVCVCVCVCTLKSYSPKSWLPWFFSDASKHSFFF